MIISLSNYSECCIICVCVCYNSYLLRTDKIISKTEEFYFYKSITKKFEGSNFELNKFFSYQIIASKYYRNAIVALLYSNINMVNVPKIRCK